MPKAISKNDTKRFNTECIRYEEEISAMITDMQNLSNYLPDDGALPHIAGVIKNAMQSLENARKRIKNAREYNNLRYENIIIYNPADQTVKKATFMQAQKFLTALEEGRIYDAD